MLAQLIPLDGGEPIELKNDITLVGRKAGVCDLVLERSSVSKMHCLIVKTDGLLFIRDLGSTNGTKVNGQKITRGALLPGDELAFARVRFRVHLGPAPATPLPENEVQTEMLDIGEHPELAELRRAASQENADIENPNDVFPVDSGEEHSSAPEAEEMAPHILPLASYQQNDGEDDPSLSAKQAPEIVPESPRIEPEGEAGGQELLPEENEASRSPSRLQEQNESRKQQSAELSEKPNGGRRVARDVAESDSDVRLLPDESAVF